MKKVLLATVAATAIAGGVQAQIQISGFVEFEAIYGENYDFDALAFWQNNQTNGQSVDTLDFAVDGRLNVDYSQSTKAGLEYGAHFELDLYQSDGEDRANYNGLTIVQGGAPTPVSIYGMGKEDRLVGDSVSFNDGYVFINSALGNVKLGDAGAAGAASNQLHVPYLVNAIEGDQYGTAENELVKYEN